MATVPVVLRFMAERTNSVNATVGEVRRQVDDLTGEINSFGLQAGLALGVATTGLVGLGVAAVGTAAKFEQYHAKLETVLKSSSEAARTMEMAIKYAAETPFEVSGIVEAAVQLEVYGQRSSEILPRVGNLAAGMGKDINQAGLVVGKALSGSLEGFESLRNEYGISNAKLKQYGAALNDTGGIAVGTAEDLEKARKALLAIIDADFGGAVERQADTLSGALSNAGDSITNLGASIGQELVPAVTTVARGISWAVESLNSFPPAAKSLVAFGGVATVVTMGLGTAALAIVPQFMTMVATVSVAAQTIPALAPAANLAAAGLTRLGQAATFAKSCLLWFVTSPLGAALVGIGVAAAGLSVAINRMEKEALAAGRAVSEQAAKMQSTSQAWRGLRDAINDAAQEQGLFVNLSGDVNESAGLLSETIAKIPALDLANALERAGFTLDGVKKSTEAARIELERIQPQADRLKNLASVPRWAGEMVDLEKEGAKDLAMEHFGGRTLISQEELRNVAASVEVTRNNLYRAVAQGNAVIPVLQGINSEFKKAADHAAKLGDFLTFSKKVGDAQSLQKAIAAINDEVASLKALLGPKGVDTSDQGLLDLLKEKAGSLEGNLAKTILDLKADREGMEATLKSMDEKAAEERVKAVQDRLAWEKVARDVSLQEERRYLEEELRAVEGNAAKQLDVQQRLRQNLKEIHAQRLEDVRANFENMANAALEGVADLGKAEGTTGAQVVAELDQVLVRLQAWKDAHKDILAASPALRTLYQGIEKRVEDQREGAVDRHKNENLANLQKQIQDIAKDAHTADQQLGAVERSVTLVNRARESGAITAKAAQEELNRLLDRERDLHEAIRKEAEARAQRTLSLRQNLTDQEIQGLELLRDRTARHNHLTARDLEDMLELTREASAEEALALEAKVAEGDAVEEELAEKRRARFEQALEMIRLEMEAEIAAAHGSAQAIQTAREEAAMKRRILDEQERQRVFGELAKEVDAVRQAEEQKTEERQRASRFRREDRKGGRHSPIMSVQEAFEGHDADSKLDEAMDGVKKDGDGKKQQGAQGGARKAKPSTRGEAPSRPQDGPKALADASEEAAQEVSGLKTAVTDTGEALKGIPQPARDLSAGLGQATTQLGALATAAGKAAAALSSLGTGGGGGGSDETGLPPAPAGTTTDGKLSYAPGAGPPGAVPAPNVPSDGYPTTGYPTLSAQQLLRIPSPEEMGARASFRPQVPAPADLPAIQAGETTNVVNLNGVAVNRDLEAQELARAAARLIEKQRARDRAMRGPWA